MFFRSRRCRRLGPPDFHTADRRPIRDCLRAAAGISTRNRRVKSPRGICVLGVFEWRTRTRSCHARSATISLLAYRTSTLYRAQIAPVPGTALRSRQYLVPRSDRASAVLLRRRPYHAVRCRDGGGQGSRCVSVGGPVPADAGTRARPVNLVCSTATHCRQSAVRVCLSFTRCPLARHRWNLTIR